MHWSLKKHILKSVHCETDSNNLISTLWDSVYHPIYFYHSVSHSAMSSSLQSWTVAFQALLSMEFSRQDYWRGCQALLQGIFLTQGLKPGLSHCMQILYHLSHQGSPPLFFFFFLSLVANKWGFPGVSVVKNPLPMQGTWVRFLDWEDPLE